MLSWLTFGLRYSVESNSVIAVCDKLNTTHLTLPYSGPLKTRKALSRASVGFVHSRLL